MAGRKERPIPAGTDSKRQRLQDGDDKSGFATPAGEDQEPHVDEKFLSLVRDALSEDIKQSAMGAFPDVAIEATSAAATKQPPRIEFAMARALSR